MTIQTNATEINAEQGSVTVRYAEPVGTMILSPVQARAIALALVRYADEADRQRAVLQGKN
ncbi:MAG: hypothetical protein HY323_09095 [Betaproteobacteria bacterium]|nr:hypothetical protein [Betaproteobacteria bacterium]